VTGQLYSQLLCKVQLYPPSRVTHKFKDCKLKLNSISSSSDYDLRVLIDWKLIPIKSQPGRNAVSLYRLGKEMDVMRTQKNKWEKYPVPLAKGF